MPDKKFVKLIFFRYDGFLVVTFLEKNYSRNFEFISYCDTHLKK